MDMKHMKHMMKDDPNETMAEEGAESKDFEDHEIENAAHKLMGAEEVKSNHKLHAAAVAHVKKKMGQMQKITSLDQLKKVAKEKIDAEDKKKGSC